ncbi:RNA polymerase sigma factor, partial [Dysosmobacter welbionis]
MAAVRLQLGFAGALGADGPLAAGARLSLQMGPHAGQPGQQILVLGQLHLEPPFLGLGPLGEDVQDQSAPVQHLNAQQLRQHPHLGGGQIVVEDHHGGAGVLAVELHLRHLALPDEGPGVRGRPVLQHNPHGLASGGLHQGGELLHSVLVGVFLFFQHRGVQPHQHHFVSYFLCLCHANSLFLIGLHDLA